MDPAFYFALAPFSLLWLAFVAYEASRAVASIKGGRRRD